MATTRTRPQTAAGGRRRAPSRSQRSTLVFTAGLVVVLLALTWAAVRVLGDGPSSADPGVAHVHGLGVNPADGSLYIATHHGAFRLGGNGPAERVGDTYQDIMGFTVAGPDHFLASGHPDVAGMRLGQPSRLGLIESTDAGRTWRSVSLSGEVDFHALAFAQGSTYGWDSTTGRFMVSSDQRTWDTRSTPRLISFAVDPADPDHIVAAAANGPLDSDDGGRTWRPLPGPALVTLSWHDTSGLVGADLDGAVYRSTDRGASWSQIGRLPGAPQALLNAGEEVYAAADVDGKTGIYRSTDAGRNWSLRYRDSA